MKNMNSAILNNVSELTKLARKFNCFYLSGLHQGICKPFIVAGHQVGLIRPDVLKYLHRFPEFEGCDSRDAQKYEANNLVLRSSNATVTEFEVFRVAGKCVELNPAFRDYEERTVKVAEVLQKLRKEDEICALKGWRDECFEVSTPFYHESLLEMDRSAVCLFGIRNYGVSVTGYINHPSKGLCIWLQQRSFTKQTWPGKWDCFVSGGLAVGYGILETAIKEAAEEASVVGELVKKLVPAGCVSFYFESERGLFPNTEYVYDLELPLDFVPQNADGEVASFELLTAAECVQRALTPQFKTTSAPVLIDFLIRRGFINPENEPNYRHLVELLHVPLQSIYYWSHEITANGDDLNLDSKRGS